ncbi:MAG TPA: hemolysin, partial [Archangium sp.]
DAAGNTASCGFSVTVRDTSPPTPGAEKGLTLWPPNHKYVTVTLAQCAASARDACSGELPLERYGRILRVTSDEVEDSLGHGDGRTCDDMDVTVGPTSVRLRAEREGTSNGRVYMVHYTVADASGNSRAGSCRVSVPHDPSGKAAVDSGPKYCVGEGCPEGQGGSLLCR